MMNMTPTRINGTERGLLYLNGEFRRVLAPGLHFDAVLKPFAKIEKVSVRRALLEHRDVEMIARAPEIEKEATIVELGDDERALVRVDGRMAYVLGAGVHVLWTVLHEIKQERFDVGTVRLPIKNLASLHRADGGERYLEFLEVPTGHRGVLLTNGEFTELLNPGSYAFWRDAAKVVLLTFDLREQVIDLGGQEFLTADRVTLRINGLVRYRIADPVKHMNAVPDGTLALYRAAQLTLRGVIGTRDLDALLADKQSVLEELGRDLTARCEALGVRIDEFGIRDIILPGEMRVLLNRVVEARKAAEANLITRREETASMRSQLNTARILESNPTLMRLRELEVLEKIATESNLSVVLGETGLSERVIKML